jgi:hypothetical protein
LPPLPLSSRLPGRFASGRPRWASAALLACAATGGAEDAPKVTVQALPRFEDVRTQARAGQLELHARLLDDVGNPLAGVGVELARAGSGSLPPATPCSGHGGRAALRTDTAGEVCVRLPTSAASDSLSLLFRGDTLHLPARAELPVASPTGTLQLAFESPALELDLDQPEQRLSLRVSGDAPGSSAVPGVVLQLEGAGLLHPIATHGWSRAGDLLSFSVDSEALGSPGPGRLLAQLQGAAQPGELAEAVALRSATVRLERGDVTLGPDMAELRILAQSRAGVPSSGWVDVSNEAQALASTPLVNGVASLRVPLESKADAHWLVRYHSDDPWWRPGEPLPIDIASSATQEPARWPWLALLAPVGYVCVRALQRPGLRKPRRSARRARPPVPASSAPAEPAPLPSGWSGIVTDAHDGHPIAGARVTATLPSLREEARGASTVSDAQGYFWLPALREPIPEGARLLVSARLHSDFQRALPPQGRVDVTLTSRRRTLLGRLVRWARAAGPPWHRAAEPTPADIADVALRRGDLDTARWAEGVQAAAFDRSEVDQQREAAVRASEPTWQQSGQPDPRLADRSS